jgi:restriction system protein
MLWWRVQPHVLRGSEILSSASEPDTTSPSSPTVAAAASEAAAFGLESHLQDFLTENWEQVPMGAEWDLLENNDGDIIGAYYNTHEVGEIDLLARHKTGRRWLVIELKRRQTSDATVGQLLRYRSWVREHLAQPGDIVEGMIICQDADSNLKYARWVCP